MERRPQRRGLRRPARARAATGRIPPSAPPPARTYTDTRLNPGTTYYYVVTAHTVRRDQRGTARVASATTPAAARHAADGRRGGLGQPQPRHRHDDRPVRPRGGRGRARPALTYTWAATGPAPVTFSANGTNAAKNATATFTQAGSLHAHRDGEERGRPDHDQQRRRHRQPDAHRHQPSRPPRPRCRRARPSSSPPPPGTSSATPSAHSRLSPGPPPARAVCLVRACSPASLPAPPPSLLPPRRVTSSAAAATVTAAPTSTALASSHKPVGRRPERHLHRHRHRQQPHRHGDVHPGRSRPARRHPLRRKRDPHHVRSGRRKPLRHRLLRRRQRERRERLPCADTDRQPGHTATALSSSLNPSTVSQSVTFTATVTGANPTGTMTFTLDGAAQPAVTLSGGQGRPHNNRPRSGDTLCHCLLRRRCKQ